MRGVEARERFVAALLARLFSEEQFRILRNARIEDEDGSSRLSGVLEMLTPKQIEDSITLMLEANPSLLDEAKLAEIWKIVGGIQIERLFPIEMRNDGKGATSD